MGKTTASRTTRYAPAIVGKLIGGAFAFSLVVLLSFRAMWVYFLIVFSPAVTLIALLAVIIVIGATLGGALAARNVIPPMKPRSSLALAVFVAAAPLTIGYTEVFLRGAPFPLPPDVEITAWSRTPWGEQKLYLQSKAQVPDLHDRLVRAAKSAEWACRYCRYQPSTRTGHAQLLRQDRRRHGPSDHAGFEIWPGDMALYDTAPSPLTQARLYYFERSWSLEWATLIIFALLATGMIYYSETRPEA